jgi:4-diphosphocytidyl-2-C-methyl-D-erythritol kinase
MLAVKTPAKINWFLLVLGKRPDGYHEIQSLMQAVSLYDTLAIEEADTLSVSTDAAIPEEDNLVYRAGLLLREVSGTSKGARITLKKEIPLAAGLGGGSSDAACALNSLNGLWGLGLSVKTLSGLAARLGSDVPFFLNGRCAVAEGRGERVSPVSVGRSYALLLVKPPLGVSSARAYSGLTKTSGNINNIRLFVRAMEAGDFRSLRAMMRNDLDAPVFSEHPEVGELKKRVAECGALVAAMSGSGPTVFGVFESRNKAEEAAKAIASENTETAAAKSKALWLSVVETLI